MHLVRLVYFSRALEAMTLAELAALLEQSQRNNAEVGITGKLCAHEQWFLQCIEGGRDAVNTLFQRIQRDERHTYVTLVSYDIVDARAFPGWAMAYAGLSEASREVVHRYTVAGDFDPRRLMPGPALALLEELPSLALPSRQEAA